LENSVPDIQVLIKGCQKNERKAQKALYKLHYSYGMSLCMRYAGTLEEAQEVMNDGFMKVFQYIKNFDAQRPFRPWLKRILINTAIDFFHKNRKQVPVVGLDHGLEQSGPDVLQEGLSYQELVALVQQLPPAYRTVFNLRAIEGYTHQEIAQMLGISEGTSKSNYARAKEKLQKSLVAHFK